MSFRIVPASAEKLKNLRDICIQTFSETYEALNTPENFRKYIHDHFSEEQLMKDLEDADSFTFLLQTEGMTGGYMKLNSGQSQTETIEGDGLEIERIYVLKRLHGKGFGREMMNIAQAKAEETEKKFLWLGVWEKNERALKFYEKQGFKKFGKHIFRLGDDDQNDYLLRKEI